MPVWPETKSVWEALRLLLGCLPFEIISAKVWMAHLPTGPSKCYLFFIRGEHAAFPGKVQRLPQPVPADAVIIVHAVNIVSQHIDFCGQFKDLFPGSGQGYPLCIRLF